MAKTTELEKTFRNNLKLSQVATEIFPDWKELWEPSEAEAQLEGFKFSGPGWYLYGTDTIFVIPSPAAGKKFWFWVYSGRNPSDAFGQIVNAPVRVDER